ncbi:class I SAM-dependent methyltransferase [Halobacillus salinus]|uniref:Class I SAM-dependent methyltransferase n=1 Tax=Halobacillus salinus TaxID=192814 RepID=A0A4Z0GXD9_9BACI|nr:class I SAM-dependent methyltransferase [Halobacillus salinus]TGB02405.1 class I SAM-dependent methyltransferase [Halobacillus salinus]
MSNDYLDLLAQFGIGGAHPGGLPLTKKLFQELELPDVKDMLEVGCGTGQTAVYLHEKFGWNVTGIDRHPVMVEKANSRLQDPSAPVQFLESDAENLDFSDECFDFILSESVLAFTDITKSLVELSRVLKDDGYLLAIEMTADRALSEEAFDEISKLYGVAKVLHEDGWEDYFKKAGFSTVEVYYTPTGLEETAVSDLNPSKQLDEKLFDLWDQHTAWILQDDRPISYRVYLCQK